MKSNQAEIARLSEKIPTLESEIGTKMSQKLSREEQKSLETLSRSISEMNDALLTLANDKAKASRT